MFAETSPSTTDHSNRHANASTLHEHERRTPFDVRGNIPEHDRAFARLANVSTLTSIRNSTLYAHYVFKAFDVNCNGAISFRDLLVTLSTLLRGSIYEKLRWAFKLYDINGDGCITRSELGEIVIAVHELMGKRTNHAMLAAEDERKCREQLDVVFRKLDINQDGVITLEEFIESCLKDDMVIQNLRVFDHQ
ncbi:hypothetical protein GE061_006413 [Apolygus lucorum]|uniref:EF-hand domain-containing protein n=1 Tax=Apolygus lucorum TaxID=248454 RepID=A0A8S9WTP5_APOLU|nr:hypothetical protein GE061_006413 [Apolygus lucorum]